MESREEKQVLKYIKKALAGESKAFEWIVRAYQKRIYYAVLQMVMNHEDANDIIQDTFVKAFTKLDTYNKEYPFYPWLYRIAINTTLNHQKQKKRNQLLSLDDSNGNHQGELAMEAEQVNEMEKNELIVEVRRALRQIPAEQRIVFMLRVKDELSYQEISEYLEISMGTVMSRLSRAREKLRALLSNYLEKKDVEVNR
ncbi:MAG: RNA polymerase sigma factor [bacterium]